MRLENYVRDVFTTRELECISHEWLDADVQLSEVEDLDRFIDSCEAQSKDFKLAGPERRSDWERGWSGDGVTNECREFPNIPYYFKKNTHVRINNKVYKDRSGYTEVKLLRMLQDLAFSKVNLDMVSGVVEFGAGTGHNITYLKRKIKKNFFGADWAVSSIENLIANSVVPKGCAHCVDYFDPLSFWSPSEQYIAFTNASLEQTASQYQKFMNFLINDVNCIYGIHIEPIKELIKSSSRLNLQSIKYAESRNYLDGFYEFMRSQGVKIVVARDFGIGSKFISGYQLLIWSK